MSQYDALDVLSIPSLVSSSDYFSNFFTFTPNIAQNIIDNHMYERQRPISRRRISQFSNAMKLNTFAPVSTITFVVQDDFSFDCVDGQHTLRAMVESEIDLVLPVMVIRGHRDKLYSRIDRGKPRTIGDTLQAHSFASEMNLTKSSTKKVASAVKIICSGYACTLTSGFTVSEEDIMIFMKSYKKEARQIFQVLMGQEHRKRLENRIPLSVSLVLYKEMPEDEWYKIDNFLFGCASDDRLAKGDPRKIVYNMYALSSGYAIYAKISRPIKVELGTLLLGWRQYYNNQELSKTPSEQQLENQLGKFPNLVGTDITFSVSGKGKMQE